MSLIDADKEKGDRANPQINADDNVANRMAHKTVSTSYRTTGNPTVSRLIFDRDSVKGFDGDNNNNIFLGYDPDITDRPILKLAKEGFSITDGDAYQILNSEQNTFKIVQQGNATITGISGFTTKIVTHGLGYTPAVLAFANVSGSNYTPLPRLVWQGGATLTLNSILNIPYIGTTEIWFQFTNGTASPEIGTVIDIKYYLLQETAN